MSVLRKCQKNILGYPWRGEDRLLLQLLPNSPSEELSAFSVSIIDFHHNSINLAMTDPSIYCIQRFEKNQKDIADFDRALRNMRSKDDAKSASLVEKFEKAKRLIVRELTNSSASSSSSAVASRADGQRMVRQLQEELEKVISDE